MRLIDADAYSAEMKDRQNAAFAWVREAAGSGNEILEACARQALATFSEAYLTLEKMPTVDAVPVVRCGECKWGKKTSKEGIFYHCGYPYEQTGKVHHPDWYCAGDARKEDTP